MSTPWPAATGPVPLPPRHQWRFGWCACCDRQTLIAPGPLIATDTGQVTLPYCVDGFERATRYVHRARLRAARHSGPP
ncbi:hypothetical protein OG455_09030 [Kitasatospora sp. NBC_01287]|uniref:hypothetical protein n=1 Tax=Kitasatospora sp. NBC_01287 TaxID=2903573 RepID=UPI00224F3BE3|nr:hypothetical protein [Kitasatospora sp. NBC_01287]MCX4745663.1 hypothetical protein [Kitasatospora sp. NBC_01287]